MRKKHRPDIQLWLPTHRQTRVPEMSYCFAAEKIILFLHAGQTVGSVFCPSKAISPQHEGEHTGKTFLHSVSNIRELRALYQISFFILIIIDNPSCCFVDIFLPQEAHDV